MRRLVSMVVGLTALAAPAVGLGVQGYVGLGGVNMGYLNSQLEFWAERQGATFSAIGLAWEGGGALWWGPWGLGAGVVSAGGAVHGRTPENQTVTAWTISVLGRLEFPLGGWVWAVGGEITGCWASASGLVDGWGLGLGAHLSLGVQIFRWGALSWQGQVGWRYLPVPALYNERGRIETRGQPGANFSGLYGRLAVELRI